MNNFSVAVVMLHPQCNMFCKFCITENTMGVLDNSHIARLFAFLNSNNVRSIVIGGGEPLLWKGSVFEFAKRAKSQGLMVQVGTNGILLPDSFEQIESVDRWVLPLDGSNERIHNSVRHFEGGHFDIVVSRLRTLQRAGKSTTISTVLLKNNIDDISNIADFLKELNRGGAFIHAWHLYQFIPEGRGGEKFANELGLSPQIYLERVSEIKSMNLGFNVFKRPRMMNSKTVAFFWQENNILKGQLGRDQFEL